MTRITHFFPVLLALFCLALSLGNESLYDGFSEGEPATHMSVVLMLSCLALVLGSFRNRDLEPAKRRTAIVLVLILLAALADELFKRHEAIGDFVKKNATFIKKEIRHYTDDMIIILAAVVGALILYRLVRSVSDRAQMRPYLLPVVTLAVAHGVLDLLGHGRTLWKAVLPEMARNDQRYLVDILSFYEESCKLWTEWFVILFLLRFFYGRSSALLWPLAVFGGLVFAGGGLWSIPDGWVGVPYVVVGGTLGYVRNYGLFLGLAAIWVGWAVVVRFCFGEDTRRRALAGLFFLTPFCLLLPRAGWLDLLGILPGGPAAALLRLATVGGLLLPFCVWVVLRGRQRSLLRLGGVIVPLALAAVIHSPLWLIVAMAALLILAVRELGSDRPAWGIGAWTAVIVLQVGVVLVLLFGLPPRLIPRTDFTPPTENLLERGVQPLP